MNDESTPPEVSPPKRKWIKRVVRGVLALVVLFVLYVLGGFFGVPLVLRHVVLSKANDKLVGSMEVGHFRFNPFTWQLKVEDFKGLTPDGAVAASFAEFKVTVVPSSIFDDAYVVREVLLDRPHGTLHIDPSGQVNLALLFSVKEGAQDAESTDSAPFEIPALVIERLEVRDAGFLTTIENVAPPFQREIEKVSFVMNDLRTHASHDNPYRFTLVTAGGEQLEINGSLRLDPLSSVGNVSLKSLDLSDFSSFGSVMDEAKVVSGVLDLQFDYKFRPLATEPEFGVENGGLVLQDFSLAASADEQPFHRIGALRMDGFHFDVVGQSARLESLAIDGASVRLVRDEVGGFQLIGNTSKPSPSREVSNDGGGSRESSGEIQFGVLANGKDIGMAITEASKQLRQLGSGKSESGEETGTFDYVVQQCVVKNSEIRLKDGSVQPPVALTIQDIAMTAGPYGSEKGQPLGFDLALSLAAGASGTINARGNLLPTDPFKSAQLVVTGNAVTMPTFGSYLAPAIGRFPTSGGLTAKLDYRMENGLIKGTNDLKIKQIEFGPQIEGSSAPRLPLKLAIAILEDSDQVISVDMAVDGDIRDPKFSYDGMIARAIHNMVEKIAMAPLSVLGGLFPDRGEVEKNFIGFAAGESRLSNEAGEMLDQLAKILKSRPGLALTLTPSIIAKEDATALSDLRFERSVANLVDKGVERKDAIQKLHDDLPREQRVSGWGFPDAKEMEQAVRKSFTATQDDLRQLAEQRAQVVADALKTEAGVRDSQVKIVTAPDSGSRRVSIGFEVAKTE